MGLGIPIYDQIVEYLGQNAFGRALLRGIRVAVYYFVSVFATEYAAQPDALLPVAGVLIMLDKLVRDKLEEKGEKKEKSN